MLKRPPLIYFLRKLLHESYGTEDLKIQIGLSDLDSRQLLPLNDVNFELCLWAADMSFKNAKRNGMFSTEILYFEAVELLKDLENL